ncbi:MAG: phage Rufus [Pseudomonadota bacterium]|jgi:hypothetical protein
MPQKVTDDEFISAWNRLKTPQGVSRVTGLTVRSVQGRRQRLIERGVTLVANDNAKAYSPSSPQSMKAKALHELAARRFTHMERDMDAVLENGTALVFSDAHYWPGEPSVAHQALVALAKSLKPQLVIANGDVFDGARVSRHPRIGWEKAPSVREEIETVCARLREVERAAPDAELIRTAGNHDLRFESYIAANAPELEGVHGTSLMDFLPHWRAGFALHINRDSPGWTVVRHTHVAGGVHSAYNSTLRAGLSYVHGHLHKLQVVPFGDYRGRRYGVDTGTLAEPQGPQFGYTMCGPTNWCSGFAVLTFRDSRLLMPELVEVIGGEAWFRGARVPL